MSVIRVKSTDTLIVESALRQVGVGDVVTYDHLTTLLGRDIRKFSWYSVTTARKTLLEESIFFEVVHGVGLRRLTDAEATKAASGYVKKARSTSRRGLKHLQHVNFNALPAELRKEHVTVSAQLGMIHLFGSTKATAKISQAATSTSHLPVGETLKLFGAQQ